MPKRKVKDHQITGQASITRFFGAASAKPQGTEAASSSRQTAAATNGAASTVTQGTFKAPLQKSAQAASSLLRPPPITSTALANGIQEAAEHTSSAASGTHRFSCSRSARAQDDAGRPDAAAARAARQHFMPPPFNGDNLNEQQRLAATAPIHEGLLMLAGTGDVTSLSSPFLLAANNFQMGPKLAPYSYCQ
jgi:hypothetical protein